MEMARSWMKFNSGYFTRLVSARNSDSTEGFFSKLAGISARRKDYASSTRSIVVQPSALSVAAVASH
jgi:hypothetical protein